MRLVDYLATRDDVDARRIGLTGISKGGIETYFTAAVDKRIAAPCRSSACKVLLGAGKQRLAGTHPHDSKRL